MKTPWRVVRVLDRKSGYDGISIYSADNVALANIVMQLGDNEREIANAIVKAVNAAAGEPGEGLVKGEK